MRTKKILITTPDYPPKLGGLSRFSKNISMTLKKLGFEVRVFVWGSPKELLKLNTHTDAADFYIHIHYMGGLFTNFPLSKTFNFCHGSEILFTSPNPLKSLIKRLTKARALEYLKRSRGNFFVSNFTREKLQEKGLKLNFGRDIVFNCAIDFNKFDIDKRTFPALGTIKLCAVARDVPHKNFFGIHQFAILLSKVSGRKVELSLTSDKFSSVDNVEVIPLDRPTDVELREIYKESHFNILLSLDHSQQGFYEGFGLTTLEAAQFKTPSVVSPFGGLPENVHHGFNGYVLSGSSESDVAKFYSEALEQFTTWSENSFQHGINSHGLSMYEKLFQRILGEAHV